MSSEKSILKLSTSDSPPVYTPSTLKFGMDDQSASPVSMMEKDKALTTALCTMRHQFATYSNKIRSGLFNLKQSPRT